MGSRKVLVALGAALALVVMATACDVEETRPVAIDALVDATTPATAYGTTNQLAVDASPNREAYLQFDLSNVANTIVEARLRLHVADVANAGSPSGGSVARLTGGWTEAGVTFANRPTTWGPTVGEIGAVSANTWVDVAVTPAVAAGTVVTLGIRTANADGAFYDSREAGANAPQLILVTGKPRPTVTGPVVAAVGDMVCPPGQPATPTLCRQMAVSDAIVADTTVSKLWALGDLQYDQGELAHFQTAYAASYGRLKAITTPAAGNHEYETAGAAGYYTYFGTAAGDPTKGYYSYDLGSAWHVVVLNSNCAAVSCAAGSAQEQWLRADLAASTRPCVAAIWHHPRFTSGGTNDTNVAPFWDALHQAGAELVLNGHVHNYERFAPQRPDGAYDPKGIVQFISGGGGRNLGGFTNVRTNSRARLSVFGYLRLTLGNGTYAWQLRDETGATRDAGTGNCR